MNDREQKAIRRLMQILEPLPPEMRWRVLVAACVLHGVDVLGGVRAAPGGGEP